MLGAEAPLTCALLEEEYTKSAQSACGQSVLSQEQPPLELTHGREGGTEFAATATTSLYLHTYPLNALLMSL